jgi:hypothetical protein
MSLRSLLGVDKALSHDVTAAIGTVSFPSSACHYARAGLISSAVQTLKKSWPRLLRVWIYVPLGTVLIMLLLWGIDSIIRLTGVSFPASVAAMLLLFLGLIALEAALGERKAKGVVKVVEVPVCYSSQ